MNVKKLIRTVNQTLKEHNLFPHNRRILVACSGGPDSMALLHLLQEIAQHRHTTWHIGVAIMDHQIRVEGAQEVKWLEAYAKSHHIPCYTIAYDVPSISKACKMSEETVGRQLRYQWLVRIANEYKYDYIAVGHHKDDQGESILAHIIRGTGMNGLIGMPVVSLEYTVPIVRPLLNVHKVELLSYIESRGVPYCIDASNDDITYQRNRIRHRVIPELSNINPAITDALIRLGASAAEDQDALMTIAQDAYKRLVTVEDGYVILSRRSLRGEILAVQRRVWQLLIAGLDAHICLSSAHQAQLQHLVQSGEPKTFTIGCITVRAQYDTIKVYCNQ